MNIVILHPDLGIGGAERLILDVALALKSKGHNVQLVTSHHDPKHCFPETVDGTLDVSVVGSWLPRSVCGKFHAVFAYLRMMFAALYLVLSVPADVVICDQISACIPVLKLRSTSVLFYCHYPDQLLTERKDLLKKVYRYPIDWFEEKTTGMADVVLVNSRFTAQVFKKTFSSLKNLQLEVLHPAIQLPFISKTQQEHPSDRTVFLSLNRFERKKNIELAIHSIRVLKSKLPRNDSHTCRLIVAGGYDERVTENKEYFQELSKLVSSYGLEDEVTLVKSPTDEEKRNLFLDSSAVLYTPENEHFGIVPLEAMSFQRPVIACNSGGPLETVVDGVTGYLCEPDAEAFAEKMKLIACNKPLAKQLGCAAAEHVQKNFLFNSFAENINRIINTMI